MSEVCNFIKKETLALVFSCEFYKIFKSTFFTEHLRTTASVSVNHVAMAMGKIKNKFCFVLQK